MNCERISHPWKKYSICSHVVMHDYLRLPFKWFLSGENTVMHRFIATLGMKIWVIHTLCLGEWFTCLYWHVAKAVWLWWCSHIKYRWIKYGYDKNMWFSNFTHFPRLMGTTCIKWMEWLPVTDFFVLLLNPSLKYTLYCVWLHSRRIWRNDASTSFKQLLTRILMTWWCKEHFLSSLFVSPLPTNKS